MVSETANGSGKINPCFADCSKSRAYSSFHVDGICENFCGSATRFFRFADCGLRAPSFSGDAVRRSKETSRGREGFSASFEQSAQSTRTINTIILSVFVESGLVEEEEEEEEEEEGSSNSICCVT